MELVNFEQYSDDFTWDYKLHFPVPTEKYIQNRSGGLPQGLDTEVEKLGFILNVTRASRNYLFKDTMEYHKKLWEYQIAHDINTIYKVLEYVLSFFDTANMSGGLLRLYELIDKKGKMTIPVIDQALSQLGFDVKPYSINPLDFYVGY